ncbi:hypothetical protein EC957_008374 [Mortierella hygrophila]|uniref:Uncharacterized protein n=1 Tax=Mortierella hygrophila TaxID=979708 RepID=A0A9P6EW96_9FUNG|nr:hypothetical protein EC957_008374 [Mortierella hygrophila]
MNNPDHYPHNFPSSPSYISDDSEDPYEESETDELHPSSDSELVSHPSDNEDVQSSQLHDSDVDTDDDGDDDEGNGLLGERDGFQFVGHSDLDVLTRPHSALSLHSDHDPLTNDMNFVYPSMTLSQECDRDGDRGRQATFPVVDSSSSAQELAAASSTATLTPVSAASTVIGTANANEMEQPDSHDPSAHDIPATLDSSLETISGQQHHYHRQQLSSSEPSDNNSNNNSNNHKLQEQRSIGDEGQGDDGTKIHTHNNSPYDSTISTVNRDTSESENKLDTYTPPPPHTSRTVHTTSSTVLTTLSTPPGVHTVDHDHRLIAPVTNQVSSSGDNEPSGYIKAAPQDHSPIKSQVNHLPQPSKEAPSPTPATVLSAPSPERNFIRTLATFTRLAGLVSLILVGGFLALEYYYRSLQPAHVALSATGVTYADNHRLAVVNLDVYSSRLRQETHVRRSPGFHVRVLKDNSLWSLQDAPAQPLYLFADPFVVCPNGGSCQIYVASLQKRHKKNSSPWLCHDTGYYVHIWFANGTRVLLSPPEIFTSRGTSDRKPLACLSPATFIGTHSDKDSSRQEDDDEDDYLAYWRERWQQMSGTVSRRFSNKSQIAFYWDPFQPVVARAKAVAHAVAVYYKQSTDRMISMLIELKGRLPSVNIKTNSRSDSSLSRARSNAKEFQARMASKVHYLGERIPQLRCKEEKARGQAKISMEEQVRAFKKTVEEQFDSVTADKILRVTDDVLSMAEASLEAILDTEAIKDLAKTMRADEIKRATERAVLKAEEQLDALLHSELARQVNRDLQRLVDDFKATPTGGKIVQEAQDMQSDAKRYFRSLQRKFRMIRLER